MIDTVVDGSDDYCVIIGDVQLMAVLVALGVSRFSFSDGN